MIRYSNGSIIKKNLANTTGEQYKVDNEIALLLWSFYLYSKKSIKSSLELFYCMIILKNKRVVSHNQILYTKLNC
jgi:hypothetical protein